MSSFSSFFSSADSAKFSNSASNLSPQTKNRKNFLIGGGIVIIGLVGIMTTLWLNLESQDNRQQASGLSEISSSVKLRSEAQSKGISLNDDEVRRVSTEIEKINNSKAGVKLSRSGAQDQAAAPESLTWQAGLTTIALNRLRNPKYSPLTDFGAELSEVKNNLNSGKLPDLKSINQSKKASSALAAITLGSQLSETAVLPTKYDWRTVHGDNFLTEVKDQGQCGSCWAFSGNATTEVAISAYFNDASKKLDLSEQVLLSCGTNTTACDGTRTLTGDYHDYVRDQGVVTESCMAYRSCDQRTASCQCPAGAKCTGLVSTYKSTYGLVPVVWAALNNSEVKVDAYATAQNIKRAIIEHGAVDTAILVYDDFSYYVGGIYQRSATSTFGGGHAISIIGWGEENGQGYWMIKNSWSQTWGIAGYGKYKMFGKDPGSVLDLAYIANHYEDVGGPDFGIEGLAGVFLLGSTPKPLLVYQDVPTLQGDSVTRKCYDKDSDGYCFWGFGAGKPSSCPASCASNSIPDCDDGKSTIIGNCAVGTGASPSPTVPAVTATPSPTQIPTATPILTPTVTLNPSISPVPTLTPNPSVSVTPTMTGTQNLAADINQDGTVNQADLTILLANYGNVTVSNQRADVNQDGKVNAIDYVYVLDFYGQTSTTTAAMCGGIQGLLCPSGFTCDKPNNYPDASGTCVPAVIK